MAHTKSHRGYPYCCRPKAKKTVKRHPKFMDVCKEIQNLIEGKRSAFVACPTGKKAVRPKTNRLSMGDRQFVAFLENTLIPDLKTSGTVETAKDFEHAVRIIKRLGGVL